MESPDTRCADVSARGTNGQVSSWGALHAGVPPSRR